MSALLTMMDLMEAKYIQLVIGYDDYVDLVFKLHGIPDDCPICIPGWYAGDMYYPGISRFDWIQDQNTRNIAIDACGAFHAFTAEAERRVDRYVDPNNYDPERYEEVWDLAMFGEWVLMLGNVVREMSPN